MAAMPASAGHAPIAAWSMRQKGRRLKPTPCASPGSGREKGVSCSDAQGEGELIWNAQSCSQMASLRPGKVTRDKKRPRREPGLREIYLAAILKFLAESRLVERLAIRLLLSISFELGTSF